MEIPQHLQNNSFRFCLLKPRSKVPYELSWQQSKNYSCEDATLLNHLAKGGNYGIVCGIGNIAVVDADSPLIETIAREKLPATFSVSTGGGGKHFYFRTNTPIETIPLSQGGGNMGHIKGISSQVVGPNCIHENGKTYSVTEDKPIAVIEATNLRLVFRNFIKPTLLEVTAKPEFNIPIEAVINTGTMTRQGFEYYGAHPMHGSQSGKNFWVNPSKNCWHCFRHGSGGYGGLSWLAVEEGIINCEDTKSGTLRGDKFKQVLAAARTRGILRFSEISSEEKKKPALEQLLEGVKLFEDEYGDCYAAIQRNKASHIAAVKSKEFKRFIILRYLEQCGKPPAREELSTLLLACEAQTLKTTDKYELNLRVAEKDGAYWYDLCDASWRFIKITRGEWKIVDNPPILFKRYNHMKAVEVADSGSSEDLDAFVSLLNLSSEEDKIIFKAYLATLLVPNIAHPPLICVGEQGAAKSSSMSATKQVIDPSIMPLLSESRNKAELIQQLSHNYIAYYDNVGELKQYQSDVFCRACTGEGFSKRELYSDDADVIYRYRRCVGLNGISPPATQPDLLDRSILLTFKRIPKTQRKRLQIVEIKINELMPRVRAYLFSVVANALEILPDVPESNLPRMADFAYFAEACARAMGYKSGQFLEAYEHNQQEQIRTAVHNSLLGDLTVEFAEAKNAEPWEGTPTEFYEALSEFAKLKKINTNTKGWPKSPSALTRSLRPFVTPLRELGYNLELDLRAPNKKGARKYMLHKVLENQEKLSEASETSATEANLTDSNPRSDNTLTVRRQTTVSQNQDAAYSSDRSDNTL